MADQAIINSTANALRSEIFAIIQVYHESILTILKELNVRDVQYPTAELTLGSGKQFISMHLTFGGGYNISISDFILFVGQEPNDLRLDRSNDSGEYLTITNDSYRAVQYLGDFLYDLKQIDFNTILNSWRERYIR
ncbi:hypothetical protein [Streptococcus thermophilus]|uniref:hypothetical protein n=1 Tax=Streptococcus thermophilus TaxID=1308 RepID=UPI00261A7168|nr:hypothetical protein [Streptococcus thermophilus]HEL0816005.1 hypothetical protein [Streptococcus equi subsp. zooepidemicus]